MDEANGAQRSVAWRVLGDPLFVFVVAGIALYLAYAGLGRDGAQTIRLAASTRAAIIADFESLTGRSATAVDIARIERDFLVDEILFREAIANDLHLTDGTVRGRLVEEMRLRITGMLPDPTDEQLVNHYSENLDRYRSEHAVTFRHVYFAERPTNDAATLQQLRAGRPVEGESFAQGREFPRYGRSALRSLFGQPFTAVLWTAPLGAWTGPVESAHGWHYVRVTERLPPTLLPFEVVRQQVENDYLASLIESAVTAHVDASLRRYEVQVER